MHLESNAFLVNARLWEQRRGQEIRAIVLIEDEGDTSFQEYLSSLYHCSCARLTISLLPGSLSIASQ